MGTEEEVLRGSLPGRPRAVHSPEGCRLRTRSSAHSWGGGGGRRGQGSQAPWLPLPRPRLPPWPTAQTGTLAALPCPAHPCPQHQLPPGPAPLPDSLPSSPSTQVVYGATGHALWEPTSSALAMLLARAPQNSLLKWPRSHVQNVHRLLSRSILPRRATEGTRGASGPRAAVCRCSQRLAADLSIRTHAHNTLRCSRQSLRFHCYSCPRPYIRVSLSRVIVWGQHSACPCNTGFQLQASSLRIRPDGKTVTEHWETGSYPASFSPVTG